jgi:hypothetical protein
MAKPGRSAWWVLYALVPLMGGLLVLEHRAALPPGWHTVVRIGIVLCIYSLVWRWLHANTLALLRTGQDQPVSMHIYEANRTAVQSRRPPRSRRPAYGDYIRGQQTTRRLKTKAHGMEINRCSLN